jgi:hypothetical protein
MVHGAVYGAKYSRRQSGPRTPPRSGPCDRRLATFAEADSERGPVAGPGRRFGLNGIGA